MSINQHSLERTGEVAVKGGAIHYRYYEPHDPEKAKRPPLIVVQGGPGACFSVLYDTLNELSDDRPTLYYDQLGAHFSPATTKHVKTVDGDVDEIMALVRALGLREISLLGHSYGGAVAASFVLRYPDLVKSLILSGPLLSTKRWIEDCHGLLRDLSLNVETLTRLEREGRTDGDDYQSAVTLFMSKHSCRLAEPPLGRAKHGRKVNRDIYTQMWGPCEFSCTGTLKDFDILSRLYGIKVPTTLICGEYDTCTPKTMHYVQTLIKGSKLHVIPGSGHHMFFDNNAAYLAAIRDGLS